MRVIVGLGNPGARYANTRHNVGFLVVDELARRVGVSLQTSPVSRFANTTVCGSPVLLMQPQTFMNRSGQALLALETQSPADALIVIHDDLDLERGSVRVKQGGGCAGHRGLLSIAEHVGTEFTRVRIGIGRPNQPAAVVDFVLGDFDVSEMAMRDATIAAAVDAVECILEQGASAAMNRYNVRLKLENNAAERFTGRN